MATEQRDPEVRKEENEKRHAEVLQFSLAIFNDTLSKTTKTHFLFSHGGSGYNTVWDKYVAFLHISVSVDIQVGN